MTRIGLHSVLRSNSREHSCYIKVFWTRLDSIAQCRRWSSQARGFTATTRRSHLGLGLGRTKTGRLWVYVRDDWPSSGTAPRAIAYFLSPTTAKSIGRSK